MNENLILFKIIIGLLLFILGIQILRLTESLFNIFNIRIWNEKISEVTQK